MHVDDVHLWDKASRLEPAAENPTAEAAVNGAGGTHRGMSLGHRADDYHWDRHAQLFRGAPEIGRVPVEASWSFGEPLQAE